MSVAKSAYDLREVRSRPAGRHGLVLAAQKGNKGLGPPRCNKGFYKSFTWMLKIIPIYSNYGNEICHSKIHRPRAPRTLICFSDADAPWAAGRKTDRDC